MENCGTKKTHKSKYEQKTTLNDRCYAFISFECFWSAIMITIIDVRIINSETFSLV